MEAVFMLVGIALALGFGLAWMHRRLPDQDDQMIDAINALLPQTQCAQCGYAGCRPYAEAMAQGEALDLCPPGGRHTFAALKTLLGRDDGAFLGAATPTPQVAKIREPDCIGCFLCVQACPVDAIVGAHGFMHTVLEAQCTGCELCLPACPMDCIELVSMPAGPTTALVPKRSGQRQGLRPKLENAQAPCIACNWCESQCPEALAPQHLLRLTRGGQLDQAVHAGLNQCIECRICDRICPSQIPLAGLFNIAKNELVQQAARQAAAAKAKARFEARTQRLAQAQANAQARRAQRLSVGNRPNWMQP